MRPSDTTQSPGERLFPLRIPPGWDPPVPAFESVFDPDVHAVSMCVIGCQHAPDQDITAFLTDLRSIAAGADICDFAAGSDHAGLKQTVGIFYWYNPTQAADWLASTVLQGFWEKHGSADTGYGIFREMTNVPTTHFETLFSGPEHDHGLSQRRSGIKGPVAHHMYWGGMRDRIPHSAVNALEASGPLGVREEDGRRIVVEAHENLCIIRSGQDWSMTEGVQRTEYLETIEPTLAAGMAFLRDQGEAVNCYACRYMHETDGTGAPVDRSFGLAYFRTMKDLEDWAENHPTHLAIFNTFLEIAPKYGPDLQLRLWHEVSVLPAGEQMAEYVNCAPGTGLLGGLS